MDDYIDGLIETEQDKDPLNRISQTLGELYGKTSDDVTVALIAACLSLTSEVRRLRAMVEPEAEAERQHLLAMLLADKISVEPDLPNDSWVADEDLLADDIPF